MTERDIFLSALDIPDPAARQAFLDRACGGNADLRRAVGELLAAHAEAGSFMEPPAEASGGRQPPDTVDHQGAHAPRSPEPLTGSLGPPASTAAFSASAVVGTVIAGRYKLLEVIGEGGMGTVFMADQTEPVKRRVAVKLVRDDRDSRAILARFEAERQAIAVMDHPHIAKLLDAGTTDAGRPFFVMELVKGVPITAFCDAHRLTVPDRLRLFQQVCSAVQHAHQKGVIHRDLKPGNVLVESHDGKPVPKVIDFGLAKAAGGLRLTDATLFTGFGSVLGTPQYMAPEQASFSAVDIDTRADVYALGVILYELLAGSPPLSRETLKKAALDEMLRAIREDDPPPPSSRIGGSAERPSLAANRQTEPAKLGRFVKGDLDWVVMKALAKDRDRRYDTATAFGADVERFLNHEPVAAGPPGAGYRLRKFVARNRGPVAAAAAVLLALTVGIAGTTTGLVQAVRARAAAETAEQNERDERVKADAARREADEQRIKAEDYAAGAGVDLALAIGQEDPRVGLLRLVEQLPRIPGRLTELRQAVVLAVLASGQAHSPLVQGREPVGYEVRHREISPDGLTAVTWGQDGVVRLWDTMTARHRVSLGEHVEGKSSGEMGFSPDGSVVWTADKYRVRLWDAGSGQPLVEVPLPPESPSKVTLSRDGRRAVILAYHWFPGRHIRAGLWDVRAGRLTVTLPDAPQPHRVEPVTIDPAGRYVAYAGYDDALRVVAADTGAVVAERPGVFESGPERAIAFSPDGSLAITSSGRTARWWRTADWAVVEHRPALGLAPDRAEFLAPDVVALLDWEDDGYFAALRPGSPAVKLRSEALRSDGRLVVTASGDVDDLAEGRLLVPPAGRRYHPEAQRLLDGRWLHLYQGLIDLRTDRNVSAPDARNLRPVHSPTVALVGPNWGRDGDAAWSATLLPRDPNLPTEALALWAQVVVRGELSPIGEFVKWDEVTWQRKRAELAAVTPPLPGFPFPGPITADRGYWQRQELAEQLDEATGDPAAEAAVLDRFIALAPTADLYYRRARARQDDRPTTAAEDYLTAYQQTRGRKPDPDELASKSRNWARPGGRPPEEYAAAVRLAEAAHRDRPESQDIANTLGMAYYRAGRYGDAVRLLTESARLHRLGQHARRYVSRVLLSPWAGLAADPDADDRPSNRAFLAMAHHRLGEADAARGRLAELRTLAASAAWAKDADVQALVREAEATLAAPPPK